MPQAEYLQYGGQAIVEGVMMRSPRHFAIACRAPNGQIVLVSEALEKTWVGRQKWLKLPFLRGSLALVDSLALGYKALKFASNVQLDPKYQPAPADGEAPPPSQEMPSERVQDVAVGFALVAGLAIGLGLFLYLPNVLAEQLTRWGVRSSLEKNLVTEVIKITFFIGYLWGISRMPEVARMFMYHGAEHKAINTLEAEQELTLENCKAQTRLHPRCGTSFAIVVLLVSLLLFTFVPRYPFPALEGRIFLAATVRFFLELLILPLIAGASYELIRLAGKFRRSELVMALFWPGLKTQLITTNEPDESQIEVALTALKAVVEAETSGATPKTAGAHLIAATLPTA